MAETKADLSRHFSVGVSEGPRQAERTRGRKSSPLWEELGLEEALFPKG